MKRRIVLGMLVAGACTFSASVHAQVNKNTVLLLGDSLSASYGLTKDAGWPHLVFSQIPKMSLVNASISGETSSGGLSRLPQLLQMHKPAHLVIELGANDGLRGLPLTQLEKNLDEMIKLGLQQGAKVHIIPMQLPPNFGAYSKNFGNVFVKIVEKYNGKNVHMAPFILEPVAQDLSLFLPDKLHPNEQGQRVIAKFVAPYFKKL